MSQQIIVIDSQKLNMIQLCLARYNYTFNEQMAPFVKADFLEEGDLMHRMLAVYYNCRRHRTRWRMNNRSHADVVDSCVVAGRNAAISMSLPVEEIEMTVDAFRQYTTHYENDGYDNILFVEQVASKILYESEDLVILYEGKLDLGVKLSNIPILPIDHKTAKQRKEPEMLSNQFIGYCWLLGVNNIEINKVGLQKTVKVPDKMQRHLLSYDPDVIAEWVEDSVWWVKDFLQKASRGEYKKNLTSCDKWGGCIFREVCATSRQARLWKLRSSFERVEAWDPGKVL